MSQDMCCKFFHTIVLSDEKRKAAAAAEAKRLKLKLIRRQAQKNNWMGKVPDMTVEDISVIR